MTNWRPLTFLALLFAACSTPATDWSSKELKPVEATVQNVAFSIQIPDGFVKDSSDTWQFQGKSFKGPEIQVSKALPRPATLDEAVKAAEVSNYEIVKKEKTADGFVVAAKSTSGAFVRLTRWLPATETDDFKCDVSEMLPRGTIPNPAALVEWMGKVCGSIQLKTPVERLQPTVEMTAFMAKLNGDNKSVRAAVKEYSAAGLETHDMEAYGLLNPTIRKAMKKNGLACYEFSAKAGMTTRTYEVCWDGAKIKLVRDLGMH